MEQTINKPEVEGYINLVKFIVSKFIKNQKIEDSEFYSYGCLALIDASKTYNSDKGSFSTWATKIIKQKLVDHYRKLKREKKISILGNDSSNLIDDVKNYVPTDLLSILLKEDKNESKIEKQNRQILIDHFLNKKSWAEIGRKLKITRERARQKGQCAIENIRNKHRSIIDDVQDFCF